MAVRFPGGTHHSLRKNIKPISPVNLPLAGENYNVLGLLFHHRRRLLPGTGLTLRGASSHISTAGTNRETTSKKKVIE